MRRWHEDIVLVEEEMRRTIVFGEYMAGEWAKRADARSCRMTPALAEGLRAYALEHVAREKKTCAMLSTRWAGLREKARVYLAGVPEDGPVPEVLIDLDEVDPTDEEGDVVGDEPVNGQGTDEADEDDADEV
jgi:hypothetical protein